MSNIIELKERLRKHQKQRDEAGGKKKALMEKLEQEFDCTDIRQANAKIEQYTARIVGMKHKFDTRLHALTDRISPELSSEEVQ